MMEKEKRVEEVRRYLDKFQLRTVCQGFWRRKKVKEKVAEIYDELTQKMSELVENAPNEAMRKKAYEQKSIYLRKEDAQAFSKDFLYNFEKKIYDLLNAAEGLLDDESVKKLALIISQDLEAASDETLKKLATLGNAFSAYILEMFLKELYISYVPDDMPDDVANFIRSLFGGPIIPVTAVFPEFKDMDD